MPSPRSKLKPSLSKGLESFSFEAIGTTWEVEAVQITQIIKDKVLARIEEFDQAYSRFRSDSLVTVMSYEAGIYTLPDDAKPMMDLYRDLYKVTKGLVTPLIGRALSDAGYDAQYSFAKKDMYPSPAWNESLDYKFPKLVIKKPVLLDFGALGKGYLVDIIGELLIKNGIEQFIINAGGDILVKGQTAQVALEHPLDPSQAIGIADIVSQSICGSAGNRRAWGEFTHIIDPKNLSSPTQYSAVWAVAGSAMLADAMTTALYFTSPEVLHKRYNFEYALLSKELSLEYSQNFPATFFDGAE